MIDDFRETFQKRTQICIRIQHLLLITSMTSSGKTYLSNALCIFTLRQHRTVRYIQANHLMLELEQARLKAIYLDYVTALSKINLLVIDDFGLTELNLEVSNQVMFNLFREHTYADACLARITDKQHSYRL